MPRIPKEDIERIQRDTDLTALVRSRGVELVKRGRQYVGCCPFHEDLTQSFVVNPVKGVFHCKGCDAAGNCIEFIVRFEGVGVRHAFELLNTGKAFTETSSRRHKKLYTRRLDLPVNPDGSDTEILNQVIDFYHDTLFKTPAALKYLKGRGLLHEEALRVFRLGFADRTLGLRIPHMETQEGGKIRRRLQSLGIFRESGHEHFTGSVVLPILNVDETVGDIYGRKIRDDLRKGTPVHLYLPGPHKGIWNAAALDEPEIILCEAPLDALTFWVNGFRNVMFTVGNDDIPDFLFDALLRKNVRRIRLAYDADVAGNRAAGRDAARFLAHGIEVFRIKFPWGSDANEYACENIPAVKSLQDLINAAEWRGVGAKGEPDTVPPPAPVVDTDIKRQPELLGEDHPAPEPVLRKPIEAATSVPVAPVPLPVRPASLLRSGEYHVLTLGSREYRVGGLEKNNSLEVLRVAVRVRRGEAFHLDSFDMTRDADRRRFIERAAEETNLERELIKRDLGKLLLLLEEAQQERITAVLSPTTQPKYDIPPEDQAEALALLKAPDLIDRLKEVFPACGLAGESKNLLGAYLACTSRKLDRPLAVIIQSTSAAGKSTLMDAVLSMFPEEERIKYSAMTGQSLYYLGETNIKNKILAIVEEEGAEKASYALKLLQSEGELTIASTGKDPQTGRMETKEYHVEGPVMIFLTTTAVEIDEELMNRCLVLTVDESREQTERIHALQRKARTIEGLVAREEKKDLLRLLRNAQRLLQPLAVVNPFAGDLTFTADRTRTRRDHEKYLTLIDSIALLHQYQRAVETRVINGRDLSYIMVTTADILLANSLAPELLGRTLDEMPPQSRRLLETIKQVVKAIMHEQDVEQSSALFSRNDLCRACGWSYAQIKRHMGRLQEYEYIVPRFGRQGSMLRYELVVGVDEPSEVAHIGLLDAVKLMNKHL